MGIRLPIIDVRGLSRIDLGFLFFLSTLVVAYAVHLLPFTLFEGFATLSNDAGSYVLLARKWSPFYLPSEAEIFTWPTQSFPPGFPWLLAVTGASESLWAGHLLVSICILLSIFLVGWMSYRQLGWFIGGLLTLTLCLLPGVVTSSMGLLSENLFLLLTLIVLILHSYIIKSQHASWVSHLLFLSFLTLVIMTRTIGIALIAAVFLVTLFDKNLAGKIKGRLIAVSILSLLLWFLWTTVDPQTNELTYTEYLKHHVGSGLTIYGSLVILWGDLSTNLMQLLSSWNHYLSLSHSNTWFFLFSYSLIFPCFITLGLRFFHGKLDAVFLGFYFVILLVWPYPSQMTRFLHPVIFLLMLQPMLFFTDASRINKTVFTKTALAFVLLGLSVNSIIVHLRLLEQRAIAINAETNWANSFEYYDSPSSEAGVMAASVYAQIMDHMTMSAQQIPNDSIVATVKPVNYSILANRRAVYLVAVVPYLQQLCNLKIMDVDVVFLSRLTTEFNQEGIELLESFRGISSDVLEVKRNQDSDVAFTMTIDQTKLNSKLTETAYECQSYQNHL